ncbi:MAG: DUF455 family protein, partial [Polyangiaceae bacterium]|nr:DUF455 family protein [Polyangiaceae bacterium]
STTVEAWARGYIESTELAHKLAPPAPPSDFATSPLPLVLRSPGRPPELEVVERARKLRRLASPRNRAHVLATFLHHELQAAELMCWAILAFPGAPRELREGLVRVFQDEVRHMAMYAVHIEALGYRVGDFPVRDWFWERIPSCATIGEFLAVMGLGFEAGNLEHAARFAERFRAVGDEDGARIQEQVAREEVPHVRFAARWFRELVGPLTFEAWKNALPPPLSPMLMRGRPLDREARLRGGMDEAFIEALDAWEPVPSGS